MDSVQARSARDRGNNWSQDEVKLLISIWRDENVIRIMDGTSRDRYVYEVIATKAREKGLERSAEQCQTKIKRLRAQFKTVFDNNRRSRRGRKTMQFYDELAEILGDRPAVHLFVCLFSNQVNVAGGAWPELIKYLTDWHVNTR